MPITTEFDWLTCVDPHEFTAFCHGRVPPERFHRLNVSWGPRIRHLMGSDGQAVFDAYAEWVATGGIGECQLPEPSFDWSGRYWSADQDAEGFIHLLRRREWLRAVGCVAEAASGDSPFPGEASTDPAHSHKKRSKKGRTEAAIARMEAQARWARERDAHRERTLWQFCNEFRDVVGNPFRPVAFHPVWRTETVLGLAAGIDESGAYERLPILADALEEAGCDSADILTHCREPGVHVRGCWAVDLVLNK